VSFAIFIASSSVLNGTSGATGPNTSSLQKLKEKLNDRCIILKYNLNMREVGQFIDKHFISTEIERKNK
jgi:hypothetical protein